MTGAIAKSKRRKRTLLSCFNCHAQKRKCDRARPCGNCVARSLAESCQYMIETTRSSSDYSVGDTQEMCAYDKSPQNISLQDLQRFIRECLADLPTIKSCRFLVNCFLASTWVWPSPNKEAFFNEFDRLWLCPTSQGIDQGLSWPWFTLFTAILATVLQSLPSKFLLEIYHPTHSTSLLATKAYQMSQEAYATCRSLGVQHDEQILISLGLCSSWQKNTGRAYLAWEHSAEAIKLASEMHLHLNVRPKEIESANWAIIDRREQLWWTLFIMDRNLSFTLDRAPASSRLTVSAQCVRNVFSPGAIEQPESVLTPSTFRIFGHKFVKILDMIDETKQAVLFLSNPAQKIALLQHLNHHLRAFEDELPKQYQLDIFRSSFSATTNLEYSEDVARARRLTLAYFYFACIQVNRPVLANAMEYRSHAEYGRLVQTCCLAATKLAELQIGSIGAALSSGKQSPMLGSFMNVFFVYDAALTLLLAISTNPQLADTSGWCTTVDELDMVLYQIAEHHSQAIKCRHIIHLLKCTARRALRKDGKAWPGEDSRDVIQFDVAGTDAQGKDQDSDLVRHEIPFFHLGIKVSWGIDLSSRSQNNTDNGSHSSEGFGQDDSWQNVSGIDFTTLDLLQADYALDNNIDWWSMAQAQYLQA